MCFLKASKSIHYVEFAYGTLILGQRFILDKQRKFVATPCKMKSNDTLSRNMRYLKWENVDRKFSQAEFDINFSMVVHNDWTFWRRDVRPIFTIRVCQLFINPIHSSRQTKLHGHFLNSHLPRWSLIIYGKRIDHCQLQIVGTTRLKLVIPQPLIRDHIIPGEILTILVNIAVQ